MCLGLMRVSRPVAGNTNFCLCVDQELSTRNFIPYKKDTLIKAGGQSHY